MATIPDSVKAQLDADWTAAGGAEPTYYVSEDFRTNPPLGQDAVWIPTETLDTRIEAVNDTYANKLHTLNIIVNTQTSEDRLKELADEVERILNATAITGMTYQKVKTRRNISDKRKKHYQELLVLDMREHLSSSASAHGAGTTGDFAVVGDLTVGGTLTTATQAQIDDLLMFGSANAAWVPCVYEIEQEIGKVKGTGYTITNIDATDTWLQFRLPLPPVKGSLKLYTSGVRVGVLDAGVADYLDTITILGVLFNTATVINQDTTNYDSQQEVETLFGAVDSSSYSVVQVRLNIVCTGAGDIDIDYVNLRCFYDT